MNRFYIIRFALACGIFFTGIFAGQGQISLTPAGSNPAAVVTMGDSIVFTGTILSSTQYPSAELLIKLPEGFELLTTSPWFKTNSLSDDKREGRISLNIQANIAANFTVYVKALCNAQTVPLAARTVTYELFENSSTTLSITASTAGISNFYDPILNVGYPASSIVTLNTSLTREFTVTQTAVNSHVNNLQVVAACDTSGFYITKVEARHSSSQSWVTVPVIKSVGGYRYVIMRDSVFSTAQGYSNRQLGYGDEVTIRETVTLRKCNGGSVNYSFAYGDGTTFCTPAATGNVTYTQPNYSYNPDIWQTSFTNTTGPTSAGDGRYVTKVQNNSTQAEAVMYDMYVNCTGIVGLSFKSAYFTDEAGNAILNNGTDTVFIPLRVITSTQYHVMLDSLNKPALASYYEARGLRALDGDGRYNDLLHGNSFTFAIRYNYIIATGICPAQLITATTRIFSIYYKTYCGGAYSNYVRAYYSSQSTGVQSTNSYQGYIGFLSIRDALVTPAALPTNAQARVSGSLYHDGNGTTRERGLNLFNLAVSGTSSYFSVIILPSGLSFDNTQSNPVRIGSTNLTLGTHYTVSPTLDTIRIQWKSDWATNTTANNYSFNIAVKNNGTTDNTKRLYIYHEYDYGNTGTLQRFGCVNAPLSYVQQQPCATLEITSLNMERRSFGYTGTNKALRVTDPAVARLSGFNMKIVSPYDDVDVEGKLKANTNIPTGIGNQMLVEFSYAYNNATPLFDTIRNNLNGISVYYNTSTNPIQIPNSAITRTYAAQTQLMRFDLAPYLRLASINALNSPDSLRVVMHLRTTTALPTTGVNVFVQMQPVTVIDNGTNRCSFLVDQVRIWNSDWSIKNSYYGTGVSVDFFSHYLTTDFAIFAFNVPFGEGQANVWTGNEYRPNGDNFSSVTVRLPNLVRVNSISKKAVSGIRGNMVNNQALTFPSDYNVTYLNGETYITINKGVARDHMTSGSNTGIGFTASIDMINPTAPNNGAMPNVWNTWGFDNYPTSATPRRDTATNQQFRVHWSSTPVNYPYQYNLTPVPVNAVPTGNRAEWTLRITNQSNFVGTDPVLPHSWIAVECPAGVTPVELRDAGTGDPVAATFASYGGTGSNKYWIQIDSVTANPYKDYILSCSYTNCTGTPQLTVKYGMSKVDYPANPADGYSNYGSPGVLAGVVSANISYTPPVIGFGGILTHRPSPGQVDKNNFCDTVGFRAEFRNGLSTEVANLRLKVRLPAGFTYDDTDPAKAKFGAGGWTSTATPTTNGSGDTLTIVLDNTKTLTAYNFPGDAAYVDFRLKVSCGADNNQSIYADFIGESGCGEAVAKTYNSQNILIAGLAPPPDYWIQNINLTAPQLLVSTDVGKNGEMILTGQFMLAGYATDDIYAIIDLPDNTDLIQVNSGLPFTQLGNRLTAPLPNTGTPSDVYTFDMKLQAVNPALWNTDTVKILVRTGKLNTLVCDTNNCTILDYGSCKDCVDTVKFAVRKLKVDFSSDTTAVSRYGDSDHEQVEISGSLVNSCAYPSGKLNIDLYYNNGTTYVPVTGVVSGSTVSNVAENGGVTPFTLVANIASNQDICDMRLVLRKNDTADNSCNPYLADSVSINVPNPVYEIQTQPAAVCQTATVSIGEQPITDYSYLWSPSSYLNPASGTPVNFTYDYATNPVYDDDDTVKYFVTVRRPGGCQSIDTIFVPLKKLPFVDARPNDTVCHDGQLNIAFIDSNGTGSTYNWTASPNTVGILASGTGNISGTLTNSGSSPETVTVSVTPEINGCDGVSKQFTVTVLPLSLFDYPDLRVWACPGAPGSEIRLSKYIDTLNLKNLVWNAVPGSPAINASTGAIAADKLVAPGTYTYTYTASNTCASDKTRKVYLRMLKGNSPKPPKDTVAICFEQAGAVNINQIFGIEAGGAWSYDPVFNPYITRSTSPTYSGAVVMNGRGIYENNVSADYHWHGMTVKKVEISYTPAAGSCLDGKEFKRVIILHE